MTARAARVAAALAAVTMVGLGDPGGVRGHALILESLPRQNEAVPPSFSRVVLRFNSRIEKALSRVSILGPTGGRVPLRVTRDGAADRLIAPVSALAPGTYTVDWKVLSADGHVTEGSLRFRVSAAE